MIDQVIVLRKNPYDLVEIYKERKYQDSKIKENVGSEILGVIANDALKSFGKEKTFEVNTTEKTPHYPGIRRITNLDGINDESFTIEQFGDVRIDEVSVRNASGGFSQSGFTFDNSSISFDNGENYFIPEAAFNTQINVPPPGMIIISGSGRINAFDNTFITFDSGTERFDETQFTTLMSDTTKKFDSSTIKYYKEVLIWYC